MKKNNLNIKAVIFDMDGVITNTMPDHFRAWQRILKDEGIHVSHYDVYSREGQTGISSIQELCALHKKPCSVKKGRELLKKKEALFKKIAKTRFITGSRNFLKSLYRKNLRLALVTGTSRHELHQILPEYLYDLFAIVVTGSDVKNGKPHPEPYLMALKRLKIKSREAVVIENAPFGIQSARAAGIQCLAIETSLPARHLQEAQHIFTSIRDLRDKIQFMPNGHPDS